jgi:molybdate transport system substrate-binding protein
MRQLRLQDSLALALLVLLATPAPPRAAPPDDLIVLCSNGLKAVAEDLIPKFEHEAKQRVTVKYGLAALLGQRIEGGEPFDVALVTPAVMDNLIARGRIASDSRAIIARSGLALEVRAGAAKPDISSVEAFKRTLRGAKGIAYAKEGASGVAFAAIVQRLGIADELKAKSRLTATGEEVSAAVVNGDVEFGVLPLSEILPVKDAQVGAVFPADVQSYIVIVGGVNAASKQGGASRALIKYLTAPAALPVITAKGMEK